VITIAAKQNQLTGGLRADAAVLDDPLEGIVHQAAVATLVARGAGAVHQLLLGQRHELAGGDLVDALHGAGGGERPARAALALVLDGGHGALGHPIDGGGDRGGGVAGVDLHVGGAVLAVAEATGVATLELLAGQVRELVDGHGPAMLLGIVGGDLGDVGRVDGATQDELLLGRVLLAVLLGELREAGRGGAAEQGCGVGGSEARSGDPTGFAGVFANIGVSA
jgi:hypothetical protein